MRSALFHTRLPPTLCNSRWCLFPASRAQAHHFGAHRRGLLSKIPRRATNPPLPTDRTTRASGRNTVPQLDNPDRLLSRRIAQQRAPRPSTSSAPPIPDSPQFPRSYSSPSRPPTLRDFLSPIPRPTLANNSVSGPSRLASELFNDVEVERLLSPSNNSPLPRSSPATTPPPSDSDTDTDTALRQGQTLLQQLRRARMAQPYQMPFKGEKGALDFDPQNPAPLSVSLTTSKNASSART